MLVPPTPFPRLKRWIGSHFWNRAPLVAHLAKFGVGSRLFALLKDRARVCVITKKRTCVHCSTHTHAHTDFFCLPENGGGSLLARARASCYHVEAILLFFSSGAHARGESPVQGGVPGGAPFEGRGCMQRAPFLCPQRPIPFL